MRWRRSAESAASREIKIKEPKDLRKLLESTPELRDMLSRVAAIAKQINLHGWAEANAGNLSVNITAEAGSLLQTADNRYLVSRSGSRFRDMARDPVANLVLIEETNNTYKSYPQDAKPSSEWGCHHKLQRLLTSRDEDEKVLLHAHPDEVILLSHTDLYQDSDELNIALADVLPEISSFLPSGVSTSLYTPPGSEELAACSSERLGSKKVLIWQDHGIICTGKSLDEALDYMEVVAKAARLLLSRFILTKLMN